MRVAKEGNVFVVIGVNIIHEKLPLAYAKKSIYPNCPKAGLCFFAVVGSLWDRHVIPIYSQQKAAIFTTGSGNHVLF